MSKKYRTVFPLKSLCLDNIIQNLSLYLQQDIGTFQYLPVNVKKQLLNKFTKRIFALKSLDIKSTLSALVCPEVEEIVTTFLLVDDDILSILNRCHQLKYLYLTRTKDHSLTTNGLLSFFPHVPALYTLQIPNCECVNDQVLMCITKHCPKLSYLDVSGCESITDISLQFLATLENLIGLNFSNTRITDEGVATLVAGPSGPKLKELSIANCSNISEVALVAISHHCKNIETLLFFNSNNPKDYNYSSFQEGTLKNLKYVEWAISW